nr:uncharacterized protein LOC113714028 [Coffea arabica]
MEVVSDYWAEGGWDLGKLPRILPVEMLERIGSKFFCWKEGSNDELSWSATQSGRFTVSSAAELLRSDAGVSWVFKHVWVAGLPIKFSCLVWRLLHYKLPVADVLAKLTVHGPSRCYCCSEYNSETLQHIFSLGDTPTAIWKLFEMPFGFSSLGRFVYEGQVLTVDILSHRILVDLKELLNSKFPVLQRQCLGKGWPTIVYQLTQMHLPIQAQYVHWIRPPEGFCKLKFDGSLVDQQGGGGGILRDSNGRMIFAFSEGYTGVTSLQAEARALCTGLELCTLLDVTALLVEGDSKVVIDAVQGSCGCPASVAAILRRIDQVTVRTLSYNHIYREGNAVADSLALFGGDTKQFSLFHSIRSLPTVVRGVFNVDRLGIGSFRYRRRCPPVRS